MTHIVAQSSKNKSTACGTNARLSGAIQNYSFHSYAPCPATAHCHDEQVFGVDTCTV